MSTQIKYQINPNAITKFIDGEAFILAGDEETICHLNPMGAAIVKIIEQKKNFQEILTEILKTFEVDKHEAEKDLNEFLNNLKENEILELSYE
jgi:hypothetical protein